MTTKQETVSVYKRRYRYDKAHLRFRAGIKKYFSKLNCLKIKKKLYKNERQNEYIKFIMHAC